VSTVRRLVRLVDEWIDTGVALLLIAAGVVLALVLASDGGTVIEVGLLLGLLGWISLRWAMSSYAWRPFGERRRRGRRKDGPAGGRTSRRHR